MMVALMFLFDFDWRTYWPIFVIVPGIGTMISGLPFSRPEDVKVPAALLRHRPWPFFIGLSATLLGITFLGRRLELFDLTQLLPFENWWGVIPIGAGSQEDSDEETPPREYSLLEENVVTLGYNPWDPYMTSYDLWEREFITHCISTHNKVIDRDWAWFLEQGFRPRVLEEYQRESAEAWRKHQVEQFRFESRQRYHREKQKRDSEKKEERWRMIKEEE